MRTTSTFEVTRWDQAAYETPDDAAQLSRATIHKTFRGALDGEGVGEGLLCQADAEDYMAGAGYVVSERVTGTLDGRSGSFVMQHGGLAGPGLEPRTFGHIVPGTGTGDLAGLSGTVEIGRDAEGKHSITLDYDLP